MSAWKFMCYFILTFIMVGGTNFDADLGIYFALFLIMVEWTILEKAMDPMAVIVNDDRSTDLMTEFFCFLW